MRKGRHDRCELRPRLQDGTQKERHEEQGQEDGGIPHDGTDRDDRDTDERAGVDTTLGIGERLDEHVRNDEDRRTADGPEDLRKQYGSPAGTRDVSRQLL